MAFDFNEARETIEAAKKRGLIREESSPDFDSTAKPAKAKPSPASNAVIPDWLQKSIEDTGTSPAPPPPDIFSGRPELP